MVAGCVSLLSLSSHYLTNARYGQEGTSVAACLFLLDCEAADRVGDSIQIPTLLCCQFEWPADLLVAAAAMTEKIINITEDQFCAPSLEGGGIASGGSCELTPYTIPREQKLLLG
ncbi:hypothetical protein ACS0TY_000363 [Phlomoides rotata]